MRKDPHIGNQALGIHQHPEYYDSLFNRDYRAENDCLEECLRRHSTATERSFVELGCGPGRNCLEFSQRGYRSLGLDLEPRMLAFANKEAERNGVTIELVQGNFIDFDLAKPVSLAACMNETIALVLTNGDIVSHLRAVSRNLLPGGIYVIETPHPRTLLEPYSGIPFRGKLEDIEIELTWGLPGDPYDCILQRYTTTVRTVARRNGEIISQTEMRMQNRYYQVQEMRALVELSGAFSEVHYYGTSHLPLLPLTSSPACNRNLTVLVKAS